jgi:tRNA A-37 threonylcarbamoyl transferase component Bud32
MARTITFGDLAKVARLAPDRAPHVYKLNDTTVVKVRDGARLSEAATMDFVRHKTSIPIPKVYAAYVDENDSTKSLLIMEYIKGEVLCDVWNSIPPAQKEEIILQLRGYLEELRAVKGTVIGRVNGGLCEDQLFESSLKTYGPYATEDAFNEGIIDVMKDASQDIFVEMVADMVRAMPQHEIVLTHSDIAPRNILVRDGKVVAILDWELAGFYPEYWEYVKALYRPDWDDSWIKERVIDKIIRAYHIEHAVIRQVRDVFW